MKLIESAHAVVALSVLSLALLAAPLGCGSPIKKPAGQSSNGPAMGATAPGASHNPKSSMRPAPVAVGMTAEYVDRELPGDVYKVNPMGNYRYNDSREQRRIARAMVLLAKMAKTLKTKTPTELVGLFAAAGMTTFMNPTGVRYYMMREGNKLIEAELQHRGVKARNALEKCSTDNRHLFTGSAGPLRRVRDVCSRLLKKLPPAP